MAFGAISNNAFRFLDIRSPKAPKGGRAVYAVDRNLLQFPETPFENVLRGTARGPNYSTDLAALPIAVGAPNPEVVISGGFVDDIESLESIIIDRSLPPEGKLAMFSAALPQADPAADQAYFVRPTASIWDQYLAATLLVVTGRPVSEATQVRLSSLLRVAGAIFAVRTDPHHDLDISPFAMASIRISTELIDPAQLRLTASRRVRIPSDGAARINQDALVTRLAVLATAEADLRRLMLERTYELPALPVVGPLPAPGPGTETQVNLQSLPLRVTVQDDAISVATRNLLMTEFGAVPKAGYLDDVDLIRAVAHIGRELTEIGAQLFGAASSNQIRGATQQIRLLQTDLKTDVVPPSEKVSKLPLLLPSPTLGPPADPGKGAPGNVQVLGIGDLRIVRQVLLRYDSGEVANIENVLVGQSKERIHSVKQSTEETLVVEQEKSTSSEKDLQSTDRFELSDEAQASIKEQRQNEAGVTVTASYGPVSVSANTKFSDTSSQEQSSKVSRQFAREIISKSVEKVEQRVREERTRKTTLQVEETSKYSQTATTKSVVGIYRWIDKTYRARVFTYGKRLMLEFMLPEPAAVYLHSKTNAPTDPEAVKKPDSFTIRASDITRYNYTSLAAQYGAEVDEPPPSVQIGKYANRSNTDSQSTKISLDDGWFGVNASASATWLEQPGGALLIQIGDTQWDSRVRPWHPQYLGGDAVGEIPVAVTILGVSAYNVMAKVVAVPSDALIEKWKLKTYKAIQSAYQLRLSEYREHKASLQRSTAQVPAGPDQANRDIERRELKRGCLEILTEQHFDGPGAVIDNPSTGWPEIDLPTAAARSPIVSFLEQSFEWDQITYTFYPYFWGRQSEWNNKISASGDDQVFAGFLSSGYARVAVPVRPAHESDVVFFLASGVIWGGSEPPSIGDPRYLAVLEEIKESLNAPDGGIPDGDPWQVTIPTSLVILDDSGGLPSWPDDSPGQGLFSPSVETCGGIPYNVAQWKDGKAIADAVRKLGYALDTSGDQLAVLRTSRSLIRAMQARFNQLGVESVLGRDLVLDGVVGPCTLRGLTYFDALRSANKWPGVG